MLSHVHITLTVIIKRSMIEIVFLILITPRRNIKEKLELAQQAVHFCFQINQGIKFPHMKFSIIKIRKTTSIILHLIITM